jgi:hypothetical protein
MIEPLNPAEMLRAELLKDKGCLPAQDEPVWELPTSYDLNVSGRYHALGRLLERHILGPGAEVRDWIEDGSLPCAEEDVIVFSSWEAFYLTHPMGKGAPIVFRVKS